MISKQIFDDVIFWVWKLKEDSISPYVDAINLKFKEHEDMLEEIWQGVFEGFVKYWSNFENVQEEIWQLKNSTGT